MRRSRTWYTGWLPHTTRAALTGLRKRGYAVRREKLEGGSSVFRVNRTAAVTALAEKLGCRFEGLYYSFGEYDGFVLLEAPNETSVTAFVFGATAPRQSLDS